MAYPGAKIRLFVDVGLAGGIVLDLAAAQAHYVGRVMRAGDGIAVFNGRDGEWWARIEISIRVRCTVRVVERTRPQAAKPDLWLDFAPIKRAPVDFLARKVTQLGVFRLWPVFTRHTVSAVPKMPVDGRCEDVIFFDGVFFEPSLTSIFFAT